MTVEVVELALPDGRLAPSELSDPFVTKIGGRPVLRICFVSFPNILDLAS